MYHFKGKNYKNEKSVFAAVPISQYLYKRILLMIVVYVEKNVEVCIKLGYYDPFI